MRLSLLLLFALPILAQITPPPSGGSVCTVTGTQTTGYVLTATNGTKGCSWQAVGGVTVDANTIKNAWYIADGGSANAITGTTTNTFPGAYAAGQVVVVKAAATNTGATTININSLGLKNVTKNGATALAAGNVVVGQDYILAYDGTQFEMLNFTLLAADLPSISAGSLIQRGNGTGGLTAAAAADIFTLFTGCSGTQYPGFDGACHTASGSGTPGGTSGQIQYNNAGAFAGFTMSGDCTTVTSTGAITCTKTNGSAFASSATVDTTNASNISSGTLGAARLPNPSASTLGGVQSAAPVTHQFVTSINTSGVPALAQPAAGDVSGLAPSATTDTTNATNITSGTLAAARVATLNQNTTGSAASLSAASALPNGTTATTQAQNDNSTKPATTAYTDLAVANGIAGVNPAVAVQAATTVVLPNSPTYSNGASGIGATLTAGSAAALVIDGYTVLLNDRILVKTQASAFQNGVYVLSTLGTGVIPYVMTRALDYDMPSDMNNTGAIPVVNGTVNVSTSWVLTSKVNTVGTDSLTFTQFTLNPTTILTGTPTNHGVSIGTSTQANNYTGAGTAGQVLTSNGASSDPTFQPVSGGATAPVAFSSIPSCTTTPALYQLTNSIYSTAYCNGSSVLSYFYGGIQLTPPVDANYAWQNQGGSTDSTTNGGSNLTFPGSGSTGTGATRLWYVTYPAGTFTITVAVRWVGVWTNFLSGGLGISDGTASEFLYVGFNSSFSTPWIAVQNCANATCSSGAFVYGQVAIVRMPDLIFFRIQDNGTNRIWSYSVDGVTYLTVATESRTATITPTRVGFGGNIQSASNTQIWAAHWIQTP